MRCENPRNTKSRCALRSLALDHGPWSHAGKGEKFTRSVPKSEGAHVRYKVKPSWFQNHRVSLAVRQQRTTAPGHLALLRSQEEAVNERGVVVEVSTHSINEKHGGSGCRDRVVSQSPPRWYFSCKAHAELRWHLTKEYLHSLTEKTPCHGSSSTPLLGRFWSICMEFCYFGRGRWLS
jgi:hypothetical protein